MTREIAGWAILGIVFLGAFLFSLYHASLSVFSRISLSRFLENRDKEYRQKRLEVYDEIRLAVESFRVIFVIAFLIGLSSFIPRGRIWAIWFFLLSLAIFFIFFDYIPRLLNSLNKKAVIQLFVPSFPLVHALAAPLIFLIRRLQKEEIEEEVREASEEEIETFIDEATEEGIIEEHEGDLLKSVVEFGDTLVREIMTPRVDMVVIRKDATFGMLRELILSEKYSRILVYKDRVDNIEGVVIAKDLLAYADDRHRDKPIEPIIRPAYFVPETMKVSRLLKEFQRRQQKLAVVIDEHGGVAGLVTVEDVLEEIVGEIRDEYDQDEEAPITRVGPGEYLISGNVNVQDLEETFNRDLADEDSITASGLITRHLGRLPRRGERLEIKGLSVEVLDVDQKRIKKLKVRRAQEAFPPEGDSK
jgi:CBS domain containing-hemolysin-like protein